MEARFRLGELPAKSTLWAEPAVWRRHVRGDEKSAERAARRRAMRSIQERGGEIIRELEPAQTIEAHIRPAWLPKSWKQPLMAKLLRFETTPILATWLNHV